jgi:hypothetical protein
MEDMWPDSREKLDEGDFRPLRTAVNVIFAIRYRSTWRVVDVALVLRIGADSPPARTRVKNFYSELAAVSYVTNVTR